MNKFRNTYRHIVIGDEEYCCIDCYSIKGQITGSIVIDIDKFDLCRSRQWHIEEMKNRRGLQYASCNENGRTLRLHRFLTGAAPNMQVDHINHNGLDNRMSNLRVCTLTENNRNKDFKKYRQASKLATGVRKLKGRYFARIMVDKKEIALGGFATLEEAIIARKEAELKYFKDYRYVEIC